MDDVYDSVFKLRDVPDDVVSQDARLEWTRMLIITTRAKIDAYENLIDNHPALKDEFKNLYGQEIINLKLKGKINGN